MDIVDMLLGRILGKERKRREHEELSGVLGVFSKWILGCSCLLVAFFVGGIMLVIAGVVSVGHDAVTVLIVIATIIVALASLIRTSLGY